LPAKLGIRPNARALLLNAPAEVRAAREGAGAGERSCRGELVVAMVFATRSRDLEAGLARVERRLASNGRVWLCWPKKSSNVATELSEAETRRIGLASGLVEVKVGAVTDVGSSLKFVRRVKDRR
jgi:hypothetical protein